MNINPDFARISIAAGDNFYEIAQVKAEGREENLRMAIDAYDKALLFFILRRFPLQYATTQNNLGVSYQSLAEVRDKEENLKKAIKAYEESLKVYTLPSFPMDYAMTKNNLGNAYSSLAEVRDKEENLKKAIKAYEESLKVYTLPSFPMDYGGVNFNLGRTYLFWAESVAKTEEEKKQMIEKAVLALKESMSAFEKEGMESWLNKAKEIYNRLKGKQS